VAWQIHLQHSNSVNEARTFNTSTALKPSVTKFMGNNAQNARTSAKLQSQHKIMAAFEGNKFKNQLSETLLN